VASAGIQVGWPGFGIAWAVVGPVKDKRRLHYAVAKGFAELVARHRLRRVEASVQQDIPQHVRWALLLGFQVESEMPKWGPNGETFLKMVRFP
jgi:hypothetical protein